MDAEQNGCGTEQMRLKCGMDMGLKCRTEWNGYGVKMRNGTDMGLKRGTDMGLKRGTDMGLKC